MLSKNETESNKRLTEARNSYWKRIHFALRRLLAFDSEQAHMQMRKTMNVIGLLARALLIMQGALRWCYF